MLKQTLSKKQRANVSCNLREAIVGLFEMDSVLDGDRGLDMSNDWSCCGEVIAQRLLRKQNLCCSTAEAFGVPYTKRCSHFGALRVLGKKRQPGGKMRVLKLVAGGWRHCCFASVGSFGIKPNLVLKKKNSHFSGCCF
jgi:hypothetical protein